MNPLKYIHSHFGAKLLLSYLVIIMVGVLVLMVSAELAVPRAFERHIASMGGMMGGSHMMGPLFNNFRAAVTEALSLAALAAFTAAVLVSLFVSQRVIAPVRAIRFASQRIAEGRYTERVGLPANLDQESLDELDQLALTFNQMAEKLEQTENIRKQLIGDVAHELRTPLTTIQGSMEGLIDGILPAEERTFQAILREAERLRRLVDDLQELSRVEAGSFELNKKPASIGGLIEETLKRMERQFLEKSVRLLKDVALDLPQVSVDADRIHQILINLLGNALQYTPSGGQVTVSARQAGMGIQIRVEDTGIGILPEHLPYLFDRFYRVDKSRSRAGGGSGIGLTITKHLVESHGGQIWAESPGPDQGSAFIFTLPISN